MRNRNMKQMDTQTDDTARHSELKTISRRWEWAGITAVTLAALLLRVWHLSQNAFGNSYYAAAVRSMMQGWSNFFFAAFDPGGYISVDKPPVALWVQTAFAKVLGFHGIALLLPQALAGTVSVVLIYWLVRRVAGVSAGLLAALVLALTPISVAVDRSNNLDTLLVLVLLLAAWAVVRAAETQRFGLLVWGGVLVGIAFNVKMMAAFIALPAFALVYILAKPRHVRGWLPHLTVAGLVTLAISFSWALIVDATLPEHRPYVGGTQNNSEMNLIIGYNGLGRILGGGQGMPGGPGMRGRRMPGPGMIPPGGQSPPVPGMNGAPGGSPGRPGMSGAPSGIRGFRGAPGLLRLANRDMAGQITWLFPLALLLLAGMIVRARPRRPLSPWALSLLLWTGWLFTHALVFSLAKGIIHPYYLTALAPALAGLVGMGTSVLWRAHRDGKWRGWLIPAGLLLTAGWQAHLVSTYPAWSRILTPLLFSCVGVAMLMFLAARLFPIRGAWQQRLSAGALGLGLLGVLISPIAWALTPVLHAGNSLMPAADPAAMNRPFPGGGFPGAVARTEKIVKFLQSQRHGERFLLAAGSAQPLSSIIIDTGEPVMAIGGFMGGDPTITVERFAAMVANKELRFVLINSGDGMMGGGANAAISQWVRAHGKTVDPALWQDRQTSTIPPAATNGMPFMRRGMMAMMSLYDCRY